ncbi:MAG TPA: peptidylprolyl isomerase [Bacteroidota bacterium]|nr:peptidylprolyl isomerase [Bacteroidota bacterium]
MPLLTKIRERMTTIFALFAGVFVVYIVLDWGMDITGRKNADRLTESQMIGYVNGKGITFREFSDAVQQNIDNQRAQTGTDPNETQIGLIRDQVWGSLVTQYLYSGEVARLELSVSDQEIVDVVKGGNPPPFLRSQFTDSTGTFNRAGYDAAISDPRNKQIMIRLESAIREQRLQEKLKSVVETGVTVSEGELIRKFSDDNIDYSAAYFYLEPNALVPDSAVTTNESDLRAYYEEHIRDYRVEATRKIKYVRFTLGPSTEDSSYVKKELEDILKRAREGADFDELAAANSALPATDAFYVHGELEPEKENAVFDAKAGDIIGPLLERDGYHLIRVEEFRGGKNPAVHARHVLVRIEGTDSAAALAKARDILKRAKAGEDIGELAVKYSDEPGASTRRGDLGWFGRGRMVKPFEDAVFAAKPGQILGPVKTQFGYHIINVIGRDSREVKIRDIRMPVEMSPKTQSDIQQKSQDFAYFARENGFEKEAELDNLTITESPAFEREASIPGIGSHPAVNRFAFEKKSGEISEPISVTRGYAVCMTSEAKDAGVRPFDEVKTSIETLVKREKKISALTAMAADAMKDMKPGDSLGTIASRFPDTQVQYLRDIKIAAAAGRAGRDPAFAGALEALSPGRISKPLAGLGGVFLVQLLGKSDFDSTAYRSQRPAILNELFLAKRDRYFTEWTQSLRESATIVDNRDLFYR